MLGKYQSESTIVGIEKRMYLGQTVSHDGPFRPGRRWPRAQTTILVIVGSIVLWTMIIAVARALLGLFG